MRASSVPGNLSKALINSLNELISQLLGKAGYEIHPEVDPHF